MKIQDKIKWRTYALGGLFTVLLFVVIGRMFWLQNVQSAELLVKARKTWEKSNVINPKRGDILDRNGQQLAYTGKAYTVIARIAPYENDKKNKDYVQDKQGTAAKLAPILGMTSADILAKLDKKADQVELRPGGWKIPKEKADQIKALNLPGISLYEETRRYYPYGVFASSVLGYVNLDGQAQMGIELSQDEQLRGEKGSFTFKKDGKGNQLPDGLESYKPAIDGNQITITLDHNIQSYVEDALNQAAAQYKMKGITAIVADPNTGEILGMGSRPSFDPNSPTGIENYRNVMVGTNFEPGSTFKIATLAAAIEEGVFNPNELYMSGTYNKIKGSKEIRDHNGGQGWGMISFKEGVKHSSNVAFVILGYERLYKQQATNKLFEYLQKFGFGEKTGIDLPGEERGLFDVNRHYYPRDIASISFGQGVGVTAIQQVAAVGAVANGGKLMKPYVIKEIRDPKTGAIVVQKKPQMVRRVVSENTAKQVRDLLDAVVNEKNGTGQPFALPGYHVAGKTGTAQVSRNGRYVPGKYINSFIGFAPKDNPKLLIYVLVDEPNIENPSAGGKIIAAPVFKSIMERSLQYMKLSPDKTAPVVAVQDETAMMPQLVGTSISQGKGLAAQAGLKAEILGNGAKVVAQYPEASAELTKGSTVYALTTKTGIALPNLAGKTLRDVMEIGALLNLNVTGVTGEGYVTSQSIPPGTVVKPGDKLAVTLTPKSSGPPAVPETEKKAGTKDKSAAN
ncbi:PASTA domain-containing penicillin-binding protein [Aneurinibacillus uraniidurans]|uniref:PASTA domain-containing penicillin-binding protein n=1 Tax=Aneurinibacillus uraniidurans TaxID=2966586 RepID=UPI00234B573A|nr:PASTA domain-containing penicillin-binding protein [Aneurinibacillus sp. B1]WCN38985.1 penicillin-binding transpeptidase domain-containing protein [Aneurinibacillus sp. B1]